MVSLVHVDMTPRFTTPCSLVDTAYVVRSGITSPVSARWWVIAYPLLAPRSLSWLDSGPTIFIPPPDIRMALASHLRVLLWHFNGWPILNSSSDTLFQPPTMIGISSIIDLRLAQPWVTLWPSYPSSGLYNLSPQPPILVSQLAWNFLTKWF